MDGIVENIYCHSLCITVSFMDYDIANLMKVITVRGKKLNTFYDHQ